jgi:hypothetical protein
MQIHMYLSIIVVIVVRDVYISIYLHTYIRTYIYVFHVAQLSRLLYLMGDTETRQMWLFVLCQESGTKNYWYRLHRHPILRYQLYVDKSCKCIINGYKYVAINTYILIGRC